MSMYKDADSTFINELGPNERFFLFHYLLFLFCYWLLIPFSFPVSCSPHLPLLFVSPFFYLSSEKDSKKIVGV